MKIALVRARYNPHGGAERFAARALQALVDDPDHAGDVTIIARRWQAEGGPARGIRYVRCDPFYLGSVWRDASFARAVRDRVTRERFDLVQSHERIAGLPVYRAGDGVHAAWLARRTRDASIGERLAVALNPHHRYLVRVERTMFEHAALRAVICNSELVRDEILARFRIDAAKLVLIRNGVDLERFSPRARDAHRVPTRTRLDIAPSARVLLFVGSGFERKGVALALAALRDVPDAVLVVVGDDKHRARYVDRANASGVSPRVRFVGAVADVLPYYAAADAFVLPTLYDPFPNAALEAMACGLPVITTDACGAAEMIDEGSNGWVVPVGAGPVLADRMNRVVRLHRDELAAMSSAARVSAEPYTLQALASRLLALYRSLIDPH